MFRRLVILLGLAHGMSDCVSGYLIGQLSKTNDLAQTGLLILLYNALAFAMQLPVGIWIDTRKSVKIYIIIALLSVISSLVFVPVSSLLAIILAGLGSAIFHVTGGMISLTTSSGKSENPGIFAAPGVVGLIAGGWLSVQTTTSDWMLAALMALVILFITLQKFPERLVPDKTATSNPTLDKHDYIMIVLLLAIAMRSAVWNIFQQIYIQNYEWLFYMAVSAMTGKIVGGFLADRLGWRNYVFFALLLATPLLTWGERNLWFLLPGIALLQSVTPVALSAMYKLLPQSPALSAAMTLGMAIAIGGLIFYIDPDNNWTFSNFIPFLSIAALLFYLFAIQKKQPL
jgi:FSR family fosmidomycin resistance protein-like MFS transporter